MRKENLEKGMKVKGYSYPIQKNVEGEIYRIFANGVDIPGKYGRVFIHFNDLKEVNGEKFEYLEEEES